MKRDIKADAQCGNCGHDFADHDYMKDSIDKWKCPVPFCETTYGFFHGGDPRQFFPDVESCSPRELKHHKAACELWNEAEARGETPEPEKCQSGYIHDDAGNVVGHVLRSPYGIGVYTYECEQFFEEREHDYEECDES